MSMRKAIKYILLLAGINLLPANLCSQDNTLFYLQGVPQRYYTNPANQPECNLFLGAPIVSSFQFKIENTGFSADQLFINDKENDEVYLFYQKTESLDNFIDKLDKINYISNELSFNLASCGFRVKKMYFTLDWSLKSFEKLSYPKELISFLGASNSFEDGHSYDLSGLNIDITSYSEIALGISRLFLDEKLSVGIRPKMLFGIGTISTTGSDIHIDTRLREWDVTANTDLNICTPGLLIQTDEDGIVELDQEMEFDSTIESASDYRKLAFGNKGFGIDAGINYKPINRVELSLSMIDLGFIKWKNYTHTVSLDGQYHYEGVEVNSSDSIDDFNDYILDTLKSSFKVTGTDQSFKTYLNTKVYLGGRFFVTPGFDVGAMSHLEFFKKTVSANIHLLANWRPSSVFGVSASYGLLDGSYTTFGLGFSSRLGPFNFYIVTDDIPTTYNVLKDGDNNTPIPNNMYSYNLRFGFNLVFGCNKIKKLKKDKPMYYSVEY
jgi:hypothetical protein